MNPNQVGAYAKQAEGILDGLGGPLGLVGRVVGMGEDELDAGIPGWSWLGIGILVGGTVAYLMRDKIERIVGR